MGRVTLTRVPSPGFPLITASPPSTRLRSRSAAGVGYLIHCLYRNFAAYPCPVLEILRHPFDCGGHAEFIQDPGPELGRNLSHHPEDADYTSFDFVPSPSARSPPSSIFFMSLFAATSSAVRSSTRFSSSLLAFAKASSA